MSALSIQPTFPIFTETDGQPLENGYIFIGAVNLNPIVNPIAAFFDAALTIPAVQPIRTSGGYPVYQGTPARLYVNSDYSIQVQNKNGSVVYSAPAATERYSDAVISEINASQVQYDPDGLGAVPTTVQTKLRETVSVKDFGAVLDGVTNDSAALQAALNTGKSVLIPHGVCLYNTSVTFVADNQCIYGLGNDSVLKSGSGSVYISSNGFDNLTIRDLKIDGTGTNGGIRVNNDSQNFDILNVYFFEGQQRVWLFECDHVTVQNCTFDTTGYGVIAQIGFVSNYVLVDGNIAQNMRSDFVEANQATTAGASEFWTISNNIYSGHQDYPTAGTEERFVGITEVRGVIITGNVIRNTAGDSAIHLEDTFGETVISNNIFDNCLCSGGNDGYIYLLNSDEHTIISGNIFLRTDPTLPLAYALDTSSASYTNRTQFVNNRVMGSGDTGNMSGLSLGNQSNTLIANNVFDSLVRAVRISATSSAAFVSNFVNACGSGIELTRTSTSNAGSDWLIADNFFKGTVGTYDVYARENTNGTSAPKRWTVQGNRFVKAVEIRGAAGATAGASGDAEDITYFNNTFATGSTLTIGGTMSQRIRFGNVFHDPAVGGGTPLVQDLRNYADDTAAATGGIPIGGLYRNGSVVQVRVT
jgi:hypothetical protein